MTRETAIKGLKAFRKEFSGYEPNEEMFDMAIKALEQESTTKNNLGVDAISRKQAIEEADKLCLETGYDNEKVIEMLNELPPVTPQPRKGHWIEHPYEAGLNWKHSMYECSECYGWLEDDSDYCPDCGADMREVEE